MALTTSAQHQPHLLRRILLTLVLASLAAVAVPQPPRLCSCDSLAGASNACLRLFTPTTCNIIPCQVSWWCNDDPTVQRICLVRDAQRDILRAGQGSPPVGNLVPCEVVTVNGTFVDPSPSLPDGAIAVTITSTADSPGTCTWAGRVATCTSLRGATTLYASNPPIVASASQFVIFLDDVTYQVNEEIRLAATNVPLKFLRLTALQDTTAGSTQPLITGAASSRFMLLSSAPGALAAAVSFTDIAFINFRSFDDSGGVFYATGTVSLAFSKCVFTQSAAERLGGAVYANRTTGAPTLRFEDSTFEDLQATSSGGALYLDGATLYIARSTFRNCNALQDYGGAISVWATPTSILASNFFFCSAPYDGGAIDMNDSPVNVTGSYIEGCTASSVGGAVGVFNSDGVAYRSSSNQYVRNLAAEQGGAIYAESGILSSTYDIFKNNEAGLFGGGLFVYYNCTATIVSPSGCENTPDSCYSPVVGLCPDFGDAC